jgi:hypothetical protein
MNNILINLGFTKRQFGGSDNYVGTRTRASSTDEEGMEQPQQFNIISPRRRVYLSRRGQNIRERLFEPDPLQRAIDDGLRRRRERPSNQTPPRPVRRRLIEDFTTPPQQLRDLPDPSQTQSPPRTPPNQSSRLDRPPPLRRRRR